MTETSLLPKSAAGTPFLHLCQKITKLSLHL
jgi:hypothetical protein